LKDRYILGKNIIFLSILAAFSFSGCSVEKIEEELSNYDAKMKWDTMCNEYKLYICGDDIPLEQKQNPTIEDVISYEWGNFEYKKDDKNHYDYLGRDPNKLMEGDCEDFAITFTEDNLREGNIKPHEIKIEFGKMGDEDYHVWVIVTKNETEYIFDTLQHYGELFSEAKKEYPKGYNVLETLYSY
jgi:hypothetical protein